jgi:hypothetical protein
VLKICVFAGISKPPETSSNLLCCLHTAVVAGSNPASPILKTLRFAGETYKRREVSGEILIFSAPAIGVGAQAYDGNAAILSGLLRQAFSEHQARSEAHGRSLELAYRWLVQVLMTFVISNSLQSSLPDSLAHSYTLERKYR